MTRKLLAEPERNLIPEATQALGPTPKARQKKKKPKKLKKEYR